MAHARIAIDIFKPGMADEALRRTREEFVPLLQAQSGFLAYDIVRTGPDTAVFIHTCATAEEAEAATRQVIDWARANIAGMIESVERHTGEVIFSTRPV